MKKPLEVGMKVEWENFDGSRSVGHVESLPKNEPMCVFVDPLDNSEIHFIHRRQITKIWVKKKREPLMELWVNIFDDGTMCLWSDQKAAVSQKYPKPIRCVHLVEKRRKK